MEKIGLEIPGFAVFIDRSESHIYSLLNGRREVTSDIALDIGNKLGFDGLRIFKLNQELPAGIENTPFLNNFKRQYRDNPEFFTSSKGERRVSHFIQFELINTDLFDTPKYVWEINEVCVLHGRTLESDVLSKHLKYFVKRGFLRSEKRPIKLRDGTFGVRLVDVFFK